MSFGQLALRTRRTPGMSLSRRNRNPAAGGLPQAARAMGPLAPPVLVIEPVRDGRAYHATVEGRLIVPASSQPFLDAARILVGEGHDPSRMLEMWRPGKVSWDLRAPLWAATELDVERGRFVRHREIRPGSLAGASKSKSSAPAAPRPRQSHQ
jgi:hypothetical protein